MGLTPNIISENQLLCKESACTGCAACAASCSEKCIALIPDLEGFLRPVIDYLNCTGCKCCSRACPILTPKISNAKRRCNSEPCPSDSDTCNVYETITYPVVYAAWNLDYDIRKKSSSGGVFTALAENILSQGGVVVGAAFDNSFIVRHIIIDKGSELYRLRGSKYVQSEINPILLCQVNELLKKDIPVLFSGTPCEVAGLISFLGRSYDNLYCCDLICHGVPSSMLFDCYIKYIESKYGRLIDISFRDKSKGWEKSGVRQSLKNGTSRFVKAVSDPYMRAFLRDYALRPSCYDCKYKNTSRVGDLTIADFWGVKNKYPMYDSDAKGTSAVIVNNEKGKSWFNACNSKLYIGVADINTAIMGNPSLVKSCSYPPEREHFYQDLKVLSFSKIIQKYHLNSSWVKDNSLIIRQYIKSAIFKIKRLVDISK